MIDAVRWVAGGAVVAGEAGGCGENNEIAFLVFLLLLLGAKFEDSPGAWKLSGISRRPAEVVTGTFMPQHTWVDTAIT